MIQATPLTNASPLSHEDHVAGRFGAQAAAYVASATHAQGEDLADLAHLAGTRPGGAALDLGCGGGHVAYAVAPGLGSVTAYDLSEDMLAAVAAEAGRRGLANIATRRGSVEALPFADAAFDLVLTRFSAHHWGRVPAALAEARRVLRLDGRLAIIDVVAPEDPLLDTHLQAWELLRDPSHGRDYRVSEWRGMLGEAGFRVGRTVARRLPLAFPAWIARMGTPEADAAAIRRLQASAPEPVRRHFAVEPDGSFTVDTATIEAEPA